MRNPTTANDVVGLIDWLLEAYTPHELARASNVSLSTLHRMRKGVATSQTMAKLQPIIDDLMLDEQQSAYGALA